MDGKFILLFGYQNKIKSLSKLMIIHIKHNVNKTEDILQSGYSAIDSKFQTIL